VLCYEFVLLNAYKMNAFKYVFCVLTIFVTLTIADRNLYAEFNPGCVMADHCSNITKLVYIRSDGDNDTVHFVFDFTRKPSLVVLTTARDAMLQVNYKLEEEDYSINFTKTPKYTFASVFNNLYEFNDINDTALMKDSKNIITMDFKRFKWNMIQLQNHSNESVEVTISADSFRAVGINKTGIVSITLKIYGRKDEGSNFPHLIHTPESGELTITLDHLTTNFTCSRFAVDLLTLSSYPFNKSEELSVNTFSDDKLSGGTFYNYLVEAKGDDDEGGGYLSWKPVIYRAANTHALNSSSTVQYDVNNYNVENDWINTPLFKIFGNNLFLHNSSYLKKSTNISFGEPNDGFYEKSNYLYWSVLVGVGAPPNENLGFFEMSIIASLLLMLTITMIMVFCIFMRWISSKRNSIIYGQ